MNYFHVLHRLHLIHHVKNQSCFQFVTQLFYLYLILRYGIENHTYVYKEFYIKMTNDLANKVEKLH